MMWNIETGKLPLPLANEIVVRSTSSLQKVIRFIFSIYTDRTARQAHDAIQMQVVRDWLQRRLRSYIRVKAYVGGTSTGRGICILLHELDELVERGPVIETRVYSTCELTGESFPSLKLKCCSNEHHFAATCK